MIQTHKQTTKNAPIRHAFVGNGERCEECGTKRAFFLHNAPNTSKDWAVK